MDEFCKSTEFLDLPQLYHAFKEEDYKERAQLVVNCYIVHRSTLFLTKVLEAQYSEDDKAILQKTSSFVLSCEIL